MNYLTQYCLAHYLVEVNGYLYKLFGGIEYFLKDSNHNYRNSASVG